MLIKKRIIIGNGDYASLLCEYIEDQGVLVDGFCCDQQFIDKNVLLEKPVFSIDKLFQDYLTSDTVLYLGIGYGNRGRTRKNLFLKCKAAGYHFENYIHHTAYIDKKTVIGEGNNIFESAVVQKNTVLGDGNLLFANCSIMHNNIIGSFNTFAAGSVCNGVVTVGDCNFVNAP